MTQRAVLCGASGRQLTRELEACCGSALIAAAAEAGLLEAAAYEEAEQALCARLRNREVEEGDA